jgi:L-ascorbate metabolism protein UlaG (beta-lactamase superfamily)
MIKEGEMKLHEKVLAGLVDLCDILFVSHNHEDHFDNFVAQQFLAQNKPVIAEKGIFKNEDFYSKITHLKNDGSEIKYTVPGVGKELLLRIYPGHQAISADAAIDDNFTVVTLPGNITVAHSGDQSWGPDFSWFDRMKDDVDIDVLMVNTWTADPDRLVKGLNPKLILPGHVNEMDHTILGRIPFWKSYKFWKNSEKKTVHLFWGEPFVYNK